VLLAILIGSRTETANRVETSEDRRVETENAPRPEAAHAPRARPRRPDDHLESRSSEGVGDPQRASRVLLNKVRQIATLRAGLPGPVEAQVNQMDDFLMGMASAVALTDPAVFQMMAREFEAEICDGTNNTDLDLMLFSRLSVMQPDVTTPRALNCGLSGRTKEDVVLWSLLDAWHNAGRPTIPAIASIEASAADERTKSRLRVPEMRAPSIQDGPPPESHRSGGKLAGRGAQR
jgi:hypothetical protein